MALRSSRLAVSLVMLIAAVLVMTSTSGVSATVGAMSITSDTTLTEDHSGSITIDANNVTLDCAGHTITGTGTDESAGTGISIDSRTGVTVKNCNVTQFSQGVGVGQSTGIVLSDNSANGNGEGITVGSSSATVTNNTANDNNSWGFILAGAAAGSTLTGNAANNNATIGFALGDTSGNELDSNHATGNDTNFDLGGSNNNTLTNNVAEGPGAGFALGDDTNNNTLDGNTAIGTSGASSWGSSVGFTVHGADNLSSGNTFTGNSALGTVRGFADLTSGSGTAGTDNTYSQNQCIGTSLASSPAGLCNPSGSFTDDDGSTFEFDIEWMAAMGITKGCNPPANDRYCPDSAVTRGQMAAFLNRAFKFPASDVDYFTDDDGTTFEDDINAIAKAGITNGCNPPANDHFCPSGQVTRGQMAAFLDRTFGYPAATIDYFVDDNTSIFEPHINAIAKAGVTLGCNPPTNDKYCPAGNVTRGQMAAFLHRASG